MSMNDEERAKEASRWNPKEPASTGWVDAPEAHPRAADSESISIRMPKTLLTILKEFAKRQGIGYQVLVKRWLDDRVIEEREKLRAKVNREKAEEKKVVPITRVPAREKAHQLYQVPKEDAA